MSDNGDSMHMNHLTANSQVPPVLIAAQETSVPSTVTQTLTTPTTADARTLYADSAIQRYWDAYLVVGTVNNMGTLSKGIGGAGGGFICLISMIAFSSTTSNPYGSLAQVFMGMGFLLGTAFGVGFFVLGVVISAQGQIMMATLDAAVNSSPFLDDMQRAKTMSLPAKKNKSTSKS